MTLKPHIEPSGRRYYDPLKTFGPKIEARARREEAKVRAAHDLARDEMAWYCPQHGLTYSIEDEPTLAERMRDKKHPPCYDSDEDEVYYCHIDKIPFPTYRARVVIHDETGKAILQTPYYRGCHKAVKNGVRMVRDYLMFGRQVERWQKHYGIQAVAA